MCGIVGAVSLRDIVGVLVQGLERLEYRGYDSCGVAVYVQGGGRGAFGLAPCAQHRACAGRHPRSAGARAHGPPAIAPHVGVAGLVSARGAVARAVARPRCVAAAVASAVAVTPAAVAAAPARRRRHHPQVQQAAARRPMLVVVDNAGAHCTAAVERVFREHGIALELLPKNVTDTLQVMDLVVNGPLKAALRARRAAALFAALQAHRSVGGRGGAAAWTPPKPSVADALRGVMEAHAVNFFTPAFCAGLRRSFVAVGLAPVDQSSSGISPSGGASGSGGGVSLGRS